MPTLAEIRIVCFWSNIGLIIFNIAQHYSITDSRFWGLIAIQMILLFVCISIALEEDAYEGRIERRTKSI